MFKQVRPSDSNASELASDEATSPQNPRSMNGKDSVFEIGVTMECVTEHRFLDQPNDSITPPRTHCITGHSRCGSRTSPSLSHRKGPRCAPPRGGGRAVDSAPAATDYHVPPRWGGFLAAPLLQHEDHSSPGLWSEPPLAELGKASCGEAASREASVVTSREASLGEAASA